MLLKLRTRDGTLILEINEPDATVQVLDEAGKVEITKPGEKGMVSISIDAGQHRLKVEKDGFQFFTQDFVMESGGQQSIKAALEPLAIDLLKLIDPRRDAAVGRWTRTGQAIDSPSIPYACLQVPYDPPARYELDADIERLKDEKGSANLGLVVDGHPTVIIIDYRGTTWMTLADAPSSANSTTSHGAILPVGRRVAIKVVVRPRSVRLLADGKQIFDWHGDPQKLLLIADWAVPDRRKLFIGAFSNYFRYHTLQITPLAADSSESSDASHAQPWNTPAFQQWMKEVAVLPAQEQVRAVAKKLQELNPGFDGKVAGSRQGSPRIENGVVTEVGLNTDNVADISPVRALTGLKALDCWGSELGTGELTDLSPLKGLQLARFSCNATAVSDLSALRGMPLMSLNCSWARVSDLSPLNGMMLTHVECGGNHVSDLSPLKGMPLAELECGASDVSDLSPLRGMPLRSLSCDGTKVSDLSPLRGMPLTNLSCKATSVSDLSPLKGIPLTTLICAETPVTDLSPINGMPLTKLSCHHTPISSLSPLKGMKLTELFCDNTPISDLSPLEGMKLKKLAFTPPKISRGVAIVRQMQSLQQIGLNYDQLIPAAEFWKKYDAGEFGKPPATAKSTLDDPAYQKWMKDVAASPAEEQLKAVIEKLRELNPNFDGHETHKFDNGAVTELRFHVESVTDLSPLPVLKGLQKLEILGAIGNRSKLSDLSPLTGMRLTELRFPFTNVADLKPLQGMPLTNLYFVQTPVADLSPLRGVALRSLHCAGTRVSDLSPVQGMPLTEAWVDGTSVADLTPLAGMKLERLTFSPDRVNKGIEVIRGMTSPQGNWGLCWNTYMPSAEFWKRYDAGEFGKPAVAANPMLSDPALPQRSNDLAATPLEKQQEAVTAKLIELNPGFDGNVRYVVSHINPPAIDGVILVRSQAVKDISPLRGLTRLRVVTLEACSNFSDLSPLMGMNLMDVNVNSTSVADLTPLKDMHLTGLACGFTQVSDLSPLRGMPLVRLSCDSSRVSDLSPLRGMPLTYLNCDSTPVTDLSPLAGMKLESLAFTPANITKGIEAIRAMPTLKQIGLNWQKYLPASAFWQKYDAGEFGKPGSPPRASSP